MALLLDNNDNSCESILLSLDAHKSVPAPFFTKTYQLVDAHKSAGEYEFIDAIVEGERVIVDVDFRYEFEIARATGTYKAILQ